MKYTTEEERRAARRAARMRHYYAHREETNAKQRERYATDPEYRARLLAQSKKTRQNASPEQKEKEREHKRRWAAEHPEVIRRNLAAWRERQKAKNE